VRSLEEYDADLDAAIDAVEAAVQEEHGGGVEVELSIMAHSTGALTTALWANRFPGGLPRSS
jgi:alpha-beta hydrolase superfamily lysophospholipase